MDSLEKIFSVIKICIRSGSVWCRQEFFRKHIKSTAQISDEAQLRKTTHRTDKSPKVS